ncbi:MAG: DUF2330 domain-containing protein [Myxococcota bacterium]
MGIPWLVAAEAAFACGGFFCDNQQPVDQSGENIVFEVNAGTVTAHVQVQYQGPSEQFAWVLPASGIPTVSLSNEQLFTLLLERTYPQPVVSYALTGECDFFGWNPYSDTDADSDADTDFDTGGGSTTGVVVLSTQTAGPYEAVVLDAASTDALVRWLEDNGYDLPDTFAAAASPYLSAGMNFLALRLAKDTAEGTLQPLAIQWAGDRPSIPLTLTGIAATPDMPVTVVVLGPSRAVPLSYLHVQLNPLVYDWFYRGRSFLSMVGLAADEAGGRGFATTFAGPTSSVGTDLGCAQYDVQGLAGLAVPLDWFQALPSHGFSGTGLLLEVLRRQVPAPNTVDELSFYNDPSLYPAEWAALQASFDPGVATADLEATIVTPCTDATAMLTRNPYLTRLTSTLSPEEMTVDPVFGFNPELPEVSRVLESELHHDCLTEETRWRLPGGYDLQVTAVDASGRPTEEWIEAQLTHKALIVEQLGESGPGTVIADHSADLRPGASPEEVSPSAPVTGGCGCGGPSEVGSVAALALGWFGARRARRRAG